MKSTNTFFLSGMVSLSIWITTGFYDKNPEPDCEGFEFTANTILINPAVDNQLQKLIVDFGSPNSQLPNAAFRQNGSNGKHFSKRGAIIKSHLFNGSVDFDLVAPADSTLVADCRHIPKMPGRLGYDFFNRKQAILLDFDRSAVCKLSDGAISNLVSDGKYREVKSSFKGNGLVVHAVINRKEYPFLFDTGFVGTFEMEPKSGLPFLKENHLNVEYLSVENEKNNFYVVSNYTKNISFDGIYYSSVIAVSESIKRQRMGMEFIKGFNWIIDFKNRKLFVKKNTRSIDKGFILKEYETGIKNSTLVIVKKNADRKKYAIGTIISAVNGKKITLESICEMQDLLNGSENWNLFEIETRQTK